VVTQKWPRMVRQRTFFWFSSFSPSSLLLEFCFCLFALPFVVVVVVVVVVELKNSKKKILTQYAY
jgi:hypothetical protein